MDVLRVVGFMFWFYIFHHLDSDGIKKYSDNFCYIFSVCKTARILMLSILEARFCSFEETWIFDEFCRECEVYKFSFNYNNRNYINILINDNDESFEEFAALFIRNI
ncbi:hypothetical protein COE25_14860 [Bacillus sp. AFS031507]|nr:hypothetical protein COE25_14860 [Bacillus sp. AFS031507]